MTFVVAALASLAVATASRNGLGRTPLMGWSTWCTSASCEQGGNVAGRNASLHDFCDESMIYSVARAMASNGLLAAGYRHIMIDDCWAWTSRDAQGALQADKSRFPHGMAALATSLHAQGFLLGLYTSVGPFTCSSGNRSGSIPGSFGHNAQDALTFASWGVDAMTLDYCDWHNDTVLLPWEVTQQMSDALNATGAPIWLLAHCVGYDLLETSWCAEFMNSYTVWTDHHDNWATTQSIFFFLAWHPIYAGALTYTWPDPDFLMTGGAGCDDLTPGVRCPGMTSDEYRSEFTVWVLAGGQLVVSTDVRNMSALQREVLLNADLLSVFTDALGAVGSCVRPAPEFLGLGVSLWVKPLAGGCVAAALHNGLATPVAAGEVVRLAELGVVGWGPATTVAVRDLWAHAALPPATGSLTAGPLAPHGIAAWRVCPA